MKLNLYRQNNKYQMSKNSGLNHLIIKRIQTGLGKNREMQSKSKKINDRILDNNMEAINLNLSVDVKNHMTKQKDFFTQQRPSNTISIELLNQKSKRKNKLLFFSSKRQYESSNEKSVKLAYGNSSPKAIKQRVHIYTSQKSIKQKRKRFSLSTNIRGESELLQHLGSDSSPDHMQTKQHQTVNMEKHMIISKYEKVTQLLKDEKYAQASIYLKQIIPYIEDKNKKKELYFWLIASLMKSNSHNKLQTIESYIVECLEEFPNFYDIYLYWAKAKINQDLQEDAIQIYQKAIKINNNNSQAYVELSNIFMKTHMPNEAFRILQEGFSNSINSVSIPTKIIENYKIFKLSLGPEITPYLERIYSNCGKKSTQFLWILGFIEKEKNNLNEALIYFLESLKYNSNKNLATKSLQNLIKIHIFKRDFYAACYDLKRSKFLNIDIKKIEKYEIFLEGVNFVMKKKNEEGIKLLNRIKDVLNKPNSKKRINSFLPPNKQIQENKISFADDPQIMSLTIKYLAYAHFKLGNHKETIKCYKLLQKIDKQLDKTSKYNMLLSEGIVLADFYQDFENSLAKFQQAKSYLCKVEPWIYQSVVTVQKQIYLQKKNGKNKFFSQIAAEQQLSSSIIQALNIMDEGFQVNSSSSNLLYHRTILNLYFSSLKTAMQDINICIEKAEENLPKYFYLRGICFSCMKNLKKAINEFSITISLSKEYALAYLERAKCYFLSGQTEMGFQDLKIYMDQCPNDLFVHKWIGDLLFQGTSYTDSIKAYNQMGNKITIDALSMRLKAQLRVSNIKHIYETMNLIKANSQFNEQAYGIDLAAYNLFFPLFSSYSINQKEKFTKQIEKIVKELNDLLEGDEVQKGRIFNLVDCMSLVAIGNFYCEKYVEAYESFLLVFEFLKSTKSRNLSKSKINPSEDENSGSDQEVFQKEKLNTEFQEQSFDLREEDVYYNMFICLLALKDFQSLKKLAEEEMLSFITNKTQKKGIEKILNFINEHRGESEKSMKLNHPNSIPIYMHPQNNSKNASKLKAKKENSTCFLEPRIENSLNSSLKKVQIILSIEKNLLTIVLFVINQKTSLIWSSYHGSNDNLNFTTFAKKLVNDLHAGYIDNMPEGPWIRRNEFGVLFTDNVLDEGNQMSFITTNRPQEQLESQTYGNGDFQDEEDKERYELQDDDEEEIPYKNIKTPQKDTIEDRKKAFLKEMKLDLGIQNKLNKIIKKD